MSLQSEVVQAFENEIDKKIKTVAWSRRRETTHLATVQRIDNDGTIWVHVYGGATETPIRDTSVTVNIGDIVKVVISNGTAVITSNVSYPTTSTAYVDAIGTEVQTFKAAAYEVLYAHDAIIENLEADTAKIHDLTVDQLTATVGYIEDLTAENITTQNISAATGYIGDLVSDNITAQNISAATGYIGDLVSDNITTQNISAATGYIGDLVSNNITAQNISATTGYIDDLTSNNITANNIIADHAKVGTIDTTQITADHAIVNNLDANYANINLANVNTAYIDHGVIRAAAIVDEQVFTVTGNKATLAKLDASKINVYNLRAENLVVSKINGQPVLGNYEAVNENQSGYSSKNPSQEGWYEFSASGFVLSTDTVVNTAKAYFTKGTGTKLYDQAYIDNLAEGLNQRIDGAIETWTGTAVPTMVTYPVSDWSQAEYDNHIGDIYYVVNTASDEDGFCYRFAYDNTSQQYGWVLIKDSDVTKALQDISDLQDFESDTVSWIEETDEGIRTIRQNHTALSGVVDKTVKDTVQLWFTKANTTAPSKPTSKVTSTSTAGNAWRVVVPAWNASYPNYYFCYQMELADGTFAWSDVVRDIAMGESQGTSRDAQTKANADIQSSVQLWYTSNSTTPPAAPSAEVTSTATTANQWTTKVPTYASATPKYHYCYQQRKGDGTFQWTTPTYDDATTTAMAKAQAALPSSTFTTFQTTTFKELVDEVDEQSSTITTMGETLRHSGNLLPHTAVTTVDREWLKDNIRPQWNNISIEAVDGYDAYKYDQSWSPTQWASGTWCILRADTWYTYSVDVRYTKAVPFSMDSLGHFQVYNNASSKTDKAHEDVASERVFSPSTIPANTWTRVSVTFLTNSLDGSGFVVYPRVNIAAGDGTLHFKNAQLEYGKIATAWSQSSSDLITVSNTVNSVKQTANTNSAHLSNITQTLGTNADGTTKDGDIVHKYNEIDQDLDGLTTRVGKTEAKITGHYATCATAAGTAAKAATIAPANSNWELYTGATVTVKFSNANTAAAPTLNVNSKGAKSILGYTGAALTEAEYKWKAGAALTFTYNGSAWLLTDNGMSARISSAESSITQTATSITSLVNMGDTYTAPDGTSVTNTLKNYVDQHDDAINIGVSKTFASSVRNILAYTNKPAVGGVRQTYSEGTEVDGAWYTYHAESTLSRITDGIRVDHYGSASGGIVIPLVAKDCVANGEKLTLSFDYRTNHNKLGNVFLLCDPTPNATQLNNPSLEATEEWEHFERSWNCVGNANVPWALLISYYKSAGKYLEIKDGSMMLERGDISTRVTSAESQIAINTEGISLTSSKVETVGNPNLTPWFSISVSDTSYWKSLHVRNGSVSNSEGLHAIYDAPDYKDGVGWAHITLDSRTSAGNNGTSNCYMNMFLEKDTLGKFVKPSEKYTWLIEVSDLNFTGAESSSALHVCPSVNNETMDVFSSINKQFKASGSASGVVTARSSFASLTQDTRGYCYIPTGCYADFYLRISLYEGEYTGLYKPYIGGKLYASQAELKVANDNINLRVEKSGVIGAINLSSEEAVISASKVDIAGAAIFSSGGAYNTATTVVKSETQWYSSTSATSATGGSWGTSQPSVAAGRFIWQRELVTYANGSTAYKPSSAGVCTQGQTNLSSYSTTSQMSSAISTAVDNIEIGGTNLLPKSSASSENLVDTGGTSATFVTEDGYPCYKVTGSSTQGFFYGSIRASTVAPKLEANTTYTYSSWIKVTTTASVTSVAHTFTSLGHHQVYNANSTASDKAHEEIAAKRVYTPANVPVGQWTYITEQFTTNDLSDSIFGKYAKHALGTDYTVYVRDMKLEKGHKATDWSPAPEDVTTRTQRIYYRKNASGTPSVPTSWVTTGNNGTNYYDQWTTKVPPIKSETNRYLYLYTCEQSLKGNGALAHTNVLLDDSMTVIDGGRIITGSIDANKINVSSINIGDLSGSIGGKNILIGTSSEWSAWITPTANTSNYTTYFYLSKNDEQSTWAKSGVVVSCSLEVEFSGVTTSSGGTFRAYSQDCFKSVSGASVGSGNNTDWNNGAAAACINYTSPPANGVYKCQKTVAFTADHSTKYALQFSIRCDYWGAGKYRIRNVKYEVGDVSTAWTPAPEDQVALVDNLKIGGVNLIKGSSSDWRWGTYQPTKYLVATRVQLTENLVKGEEYTMSIWGSMPTRSDKATTWYAIYWGGGSVHLGDITSMPNGKGSVTFTAPNSTNADTENMYLCIYNSPLVGESGTTYGASITRMKLERGVKATDWEASPHDASKSSGRSMNLISYNPDPETMLNEFCIAAREPGEPVFPLYYHPGSENSGSLGRAYVTNFTGDTASSMYLMFCPYRPNEFKEGDVIRFEGRMANWDAAVTCRLSIWTYKTSTGSNAVSVTSSSFSLPQNAWTNVSAELTIPASFNTADAKYYLIGVISGSGNNCRLAVTADSVCYKVDKSAASTATNYITADSSGIKIANANPSSATTYQHQTASSTEFFVSGNKRTAVTSTGLEVFDTNGSTSLAKFGASARIGKSTGGHVDVDSDSVDIANGTTVIASFKTTADGVPILWLGDPEINIVGAHTTGTSAYDNLYLYAYGHNNSANSQIMLDAYGDGHARLRIKGTSGDFEAYGSGLTAHQVFAAGTGATTSPATTATFRLLVADDIPSLAASKIDSGTFDAARIPTATVNKGGTGKTSHTVNSVIIGGTTTTGALQNVAAASGAFYSTGANVKPSFGTLPIAQGGTGQTSISSTTGTRNTSNTTAGTITCLKFGKVGFVRLDGVAVKSFVNRAGFAYLPTGYYPKTTWYGQINGVAGGFFLIDTDGTILLDPAYSNATLYGCATYPIA